MRTIDQIIQERKQQELESKTSQIQSNFYVSYPVSPDQASKQYDIAKSTNLPIGLVRAKENEILKRTELSTFNNEDWVNNFPAVANQLADIAKAPAIKDDLETLTNLEVLARSTKEKFQQSALQDQTVDTRLKRMGFEATRGESFKLSPIEESDIATFDASQPKDYNLNWLESVPSETTGATRTQYGVIRNALPKAGVGAGIGAAIGYAITKNPAGATRGAKILGGFTAASAIGYEMAKLETAGAYDELRTVVDENGKPLEKNVAAGAAIATGVINGAIELIPVKVGLDSVKKAFSRAGIKQATKNPIIREYLGNIAKGVLVEGGTEGAQELFNIIAAESAKVFSDGDFKRLGMKDANDIEGLFKFVSDSASRIGQSMAAGSAGGGGIAAVGGGPIATKRIYDQRKVNEREQEVIGSILDTAKQSKVLNRSSELFKDVTANTLGETNIYLPVDDFKTYFQDKPDKLASFYANAAIQDQIQEAVDTGGNIIIKANELSAAIKADPELESLREFMKLTPESFTSLEAQDEFLQTVVPSYFQEENTRQERSDQDVVKQNIRHQLSNLGMPNEIAKQNIELLTSFYDTQVKRYGAKDAQKIVDSYIGNLEANVQRFQKQPINKIEDLDLFLDKARKPIKQPKAGKPLLKSLKEMGGVQLGSNLAGELNALGITTKTAPALFKKKGGIGDVDNIPLSEFQAKFPNAQATADETGNYVARQYLLDLLQKESFGEDITQTKSEEQSQIENFLEQLDREGIDINLPNEEIKKRIKELESRTYEQSYQEIFQARVAAAQELNDNLQQKLKINSDGSVTVYHGTSKENSKKIQEGRSLNESSYFSPRKTGTQNGDSPLDVAKRKFGKEGTVIELKVDAKALEGAAAGSELFAPKKLTRGEDGVWTSGETYFQTPQTKSEAFKKWFGDSKVVDEKGEPLVVYHGSNAKFDTFDTKKIGQTATAEGYGFYLTDNKEIAKGYQRDGGSLIEAYLSMQKPLDGKRKPFNVKEISQVLNKMVDIEIEKFRDEIVDYKDSFLSNFVDTYSLSKAQAIKETAQSIVDGNDTAIDQISELSNVFGDKTTVPEAVRDTLGFDGVEVKDFQQGEGTVYLAWFPTQIKSVENKGTFDPSNPNILFQSATTFYSALEKQITDLPQGKGSPEQWSGIIKNLTQKGVKQEELDWTGVEDWIKEQKGSVSKEQILDYLKANKIEVEEVKLGDKLKISDLEISQKESERDWEKDWIVKIKNTNEVKEFRSFLSKEQALERALLSFNEDMEKPTKFSKYTLAGGENYRELLLTLPVNESVNQEKIGSLRIAAKALIEQEGSWKDNYDTAGRALNDLVANPSLLNDYNFDEKQAKSIKEYLDSKNIRKNEKSDVYKSSHYDEPNILAHIRFNERTDKDGARVMFVEELQSDWHQEGRKKGYKGEPVYKGFTPVGFSWDKGVKGSAVIHKLVNERTGQVVGEGTIKSEVVEKAGFTNMVPDAPFKTTWNELAFKRALMWAVENNFDKVAWTTGEQQAERYDLSKQIDSIAYAKASDGKTVSLDVEKNGSNVFSRANISINELPDIIGKEVADKIVKGEYTDTNDLGYNVLSGLDLKVGGEGMKAFYDKIVPSMVNKLAKKFGGKVEQTKIDIAAGEVKDYGYSTLEDKNRYLESWSLEITSAMRESIQQQGLPLFQNEAKPQGQTQFLPNKPIITLFETADRSTLLHELGHVFLQIQADLSKLSNMPKQFQKDWAVIEKFLDIKNGKITREAHEKFARSFETYLREGKAPTVELREAFRKFKQWLTTIYENVLQLNVKINNDIRGVFDRMLATDEQIELNSDTPLFKVDTNILELLTKAERKDYLKRTEEAKEKTKEILLRKALKQKEKENSKAYKEDRSKAEAEVRDEMNKDKTFRALHFLKTGKLLGEDTELNPVKLNRKEIENYDGEFIKYLPKEIFGKNSAPVEMIAEEFGFKNGSEMLFALANAKDFNKELETATDAEMMRRYGNMLFDGSLEREALEASDSEAVANKIVYELDAVNRKVKSVTESKDAYKAKAREMFATKKIPDATDVNKYYINGLKAARETGKALGKKDYEKAVEWKKKQLLNHYLFQESSRFKKELAQANRSYKLIKRKPSKNKVLLDEEFREKALSLLQNFGLAEKPFDYKELDVNELEAWKAEKKSEEGILGLVEFPEIADFKTKDFNQLTTEEFRTLNDSIQNLAFVGRQERLIVIDGVKKSIDEFVDSVQENLDKIPDKQVKIGELSKKEKRKKFFDSAVSFLDKVQTTVFKIDDKQELGVFYQGFVKGLTEGERNKDNLSRESYAKLDEIFKKHYKKGIIPSKETYFETLNQSLTKKSVIALALNWGNQTNRKRIRDGYKWTDQQVNQILTTLDKNDLAFVQDIWDFINSYWPSLESIDKKIYGIAPKKEAASPITVNTKDGEVNLRGGYYPISYTEDTDLLETTAKELNSFFVNNQGSNLNVNKSYSKERATGRVQGKVDLTLNPLFRHLENVVNDIALKEPAWNAYKLVKNNKLKTQLKKKIGNADYQSLVSWVKDVYGKTSVQEGYLNKFARRARGATVLYQMGFKLSTVIIQATGLLNSTVKLGYGNMGYGIWKALGNGNPISINKAIREAEAKSKILKNRANSFNRDVSEIMQRMERSKGLMPDVAKYAFFAITSAQKMVDVPTWYGAYYKGFKEFKDDAKAVEYADKILESTQGTSHKYALSAIERNESGFAKIMTTFYSYVNVKLALLRQSYIGTDFKKPKDVAKFVNDMTLLFIADAIATEFLRRGISEALKDGDDEEEDKKKLTLKYLNLVGQSIVAPIPGVREVYSSATSDFSGGGMPAGLGIIDIVGKRGIGTIGKEILKEDEVDWVNVLRGVNNTSAVFSAGGGAQIDIFLGALQKQREGEEVAPIDFLLKSKK